MGRGWRTWCHQPDGTKSTSSTPCSKSISIPLPGAAGSKGQVKGQHSDGSIQMAAAGAPWSLGTHPCVHGDGKIEQQQARAGPSSGGRASKPSAGGSLRSKHCSPVVEENSPGSASGGSIHHRLRPARLTLQLKELSTSFVMRGGRVVQDTDVGQQQLAGRNGEG